MCGSVKAKPCRDFIKAIYNLPFPSPFKRLLEISRTLIILKDWVVVSCLPAEDDQQTPAACHPWPREQGIVHQDQDVTGASVVDLAPDNLIPTI